MSEVKIEIAQDKGTLGPYGPVGTETGDFTPLDAEDTSPLDEAGMFSQFTFTYLNKLLKYGSQNNLQLGDIPPPPKRLIANTAFDEFGKVWNEEQQKEKPSFLRATLVYFKTDIIKVLTLGVIAAAAPVVTPLLLFEYLNAIIDPKPLTYHAYLYALGMTLLMVFQTMCLGRLFIFAINFACRMRAAYDCLLFSKVFKLNLDAWKTTDQGQVYNLMGQDVETLFRQSFIVIIAAMFPAQVILCFGLLFWMLGWPTIAGIVVFIIAVPFNYRITKSFIKFMVARYVAADGRVKILNECLQAIKVVKFYAWEDSFISQMVKKRENEVKQVRDLMMANMKFQFSANFAPNFCQFVIMVTFALVGELTLSQVFSVLTILNLLRYAFTLIPLIYTTYVVFRAAITRLGKFLCLPELKVLPPPPEDGVVRVTTCDIKWDSESQIVLKNVNLEIKKGELAMIVGAVGSGKTTLLNAILQENITGDNGKIHLGGAVAYVAQVAWITTDTLRGNILTGKKMQKDKYLKTLQAADLGQDINLLPDRDLTEIGAKGINISGGQKQRVSIARAVYSDADIYLFDDPLSAVDVHVGQHLFDHCINGALKNKTRILVTNQLQHLTKADTIYLVHDNAVRKVKIDDPDLKDMMDAMEAAKVKTDVVDGTPQTTPLQTPTINLQVASPKSGTGSDGTNTPLKLDTPLTAGTLTADHLHRKDDSFTRSFSGTSDRSRSPTLSDQLSVEELQDRELTLASLDEAEETEDAQLDRKETKAKLIEDEDRITGAVALSAYLTYTRYFGGYCWYIGAGLLALGMWGFVLLSQLWLGLWARHSLFPDKSTSFWLTGYFLLICGSAVCTLGREWMFADAVVHCCAKLHTLALTAVLKSPMSFFDTTPVGRIVNRFTSDVMELDFQLPLCFDNLAHLTLMIGLALLAVVITVPAMIPVLLVLGFFYRWFAKYFQKSSLELRRLYNISKSPMFSSFNEVMQGVASIRAYRLQQYYVDEFMVKVDNNHKAYVAERLGFEWMRFRCGMLGTTSLLILSFLFLVLRDMVPPELGGLAVAQTIGLISAIGFWVEVLLQVDMAMNCVERLKAFSNLSAEEATANRSEPAADWPKTGAIQYENVCMKYREKTPEILHSLNIQVPDGSKVGIVGRTGSGKSSMLLAMFRIPTDTCQTGSIHIDGVDTGTLTKTGLRSRLAIIPQDPVVFDGTVRSNLDPLKEFDDGAMWEALKLSHLDTFVKSAVDNDIEGDDKSDKLNMKVTGGGGNLSQGQAQLVCLARAVLRKRKVLLMDEATASVDMHTDRLIQDTIRSTFADCTVLTIAHRLHTVLDCDMILVMADGTVAEYGPPDELMQKPDGLLAGMVQKLREKRGKRIRKRSSGGTPMKIK